MSIITLSNKNVDFPGPENSPGDRPIAMGGGLSVERLLRAYNNGIFPWYSGDKPILWWSPDPRFVLFPDEIKVSRSMKKYFNRDIFKLTFDKSFARVIRACQASPRKDKGTWIVEDMVDAYCRLHEAGYAHSVEVWQGDELVGGMYGVSLGRSFFGESMFTKTRNGSKFALIQLARILEKNEFDIIDCQVYTDHLHSMGAKMISRLDFLDIINFSMKKPTIRGSWENIFC